jgi:hypothetical protein
MHLDRELSLGPFIVDLHGRLSPAEPETCPAFSVRWRGRLVRARMAHGKPGSSCGGLELSTCLGRVPSTIGPTEPQERRHAVLAALRDLPLLVPPDWRLQLAADHSVMMRTTTRLDLPVSASALLTEVTLFLMILAPYLDVLDEDGVALAAEGMVKT